MGRTLLVLLALVAGSIAGPIQEISISDRCAKQCTLSNKFNYEAGTTYEFTYETDVRTAIQGASEDHAGVHLSSNVYLDFISQCEMVLRMSDVRLTEHDPETSTMKPVKAFLISDLENNPLTVSYQDGNIEELCMANPESDKTLNIKRGILSLIQNNMDDINSDQTVSESDVAGECETQYTSEDKGWYSKLIKKTKNLLGCKGRQNANSAIQGIPYQSNSAVQGLPLVKSSQECEQEIVKDTGRLQVASCHENHVFVPFSRQDSGATTHNTQTLTFVKEYKSGAKSSPVNIRAPVVFQHSFGASGDNNRKDVERKLMDICDTTVNGVTPETPKIFSALVQSMKSISSKDLDLIYKKIQSNDICPTNNKRVAKFFLDAVPMVGSTESVSYMAQLIVSGKVSGLEADMWMTTLSFIQRPTLEMLRDVKMLLTDDNLLEKAMLPVSSLVNTVCRNNPSCENYVEVQKIISLLEKRIDSACKITDENFRTSLLAIRAIGNAGFGTSATPTLLKCIQKKENPIEIRLSATEAFRRIPCTADKTGIMSVFSDVEEDSEMRITAYKSLMECATDDLIKKVKIVLSKETVNQVGSYVWTHLTNLMETSDPHKQTIRSILEDETLKQEFNLDSRKFSRNYEGSLFLEKINTGATVEGDLIWSSKSFIPRSGMFNLTVDLFGSAFNVFEIGGRMEGLEYFLEHYFGPNGYFSENDVQTAVEETGVDVIKTDKVKRIDRRMNSVMDDLRGNLYVRVFGNEIKYMNFQGINSFLSQNSINVIDILMKLSEDNDYQFTQSTMFMDSSVIIPTGSGFPLNLTVNGTATVDLKASGKMDVMKLTTSPPTLDIKGIIRPSAAVVISTIMGVDALSTQVGVKMVSTLHTGTSVQGRISLAEGTILNAEFDLPEEKMDIINVKSEFFTVHREKERMQKMITQDRKEHQICSGNTLAKITGLEICGELSFTNASLVENAPYFPITGPMNAGITLYKRDVSMTGYKFEARSTHNRQENIIRVSFATPNSKVSRNLGVDLSLNKVDGVLEASLTSPWKKGTFKGSLVNERLHKSLSGKMNWDNSFKFDITADLQLEKSGPGMIYTPTITVNIPSFPTLDMTGSVKYAPWKLFETDLVLKGLSAKPITLKSTIADKSKVVLAKASASFGAKNEYSFDSSMQKTEYKKKVIYKPRLSIRSPTQELVAFGGTFTNVYGKNIELDFVLDKIVSTPVMIKSNYITKAFRRGRIQKIVRVDFRSTLLSVKTKSKLDNRNWKTIATDIDFTYVIPQIARDGLKLVSKISNLSNKKSTLGKFSMNLESNKNPDYNLKVMSNMNHNWRSSGVNMDVAYGSNFKNKDKQISLMADLTRSIKSWTYASLALNSKLEIGTDLRLVSKIDHSHQRRSLNNTMMFRVNKDSVDTSLTLEDRSKSQTDLYGNLQINLPRGRKIMLSQTVTEDESGEFTSATDANFGKSKNTIVTSWKKAPLAMKLSSDISLNQFEPVAFSGEYNIEDNARKATASVAKGSSKYSISMSTKSNPGTLQAFADVSCPSRRVIGNFETTKAESKYTSRAELRWDADRDDTKRIALFGSGQLDGLSNIDGSFSVQYPSRTISINMKQTISSKYFSHLDFKWDPKQTFAIDTTLGSYNNDDTIEMVGNIKLSTPYSGFESVDLTANHQISGNAFTSKVDLNWDKRNSVSGTFTLKRPLSFSNIDASFVAKAPSQGVRNMQASLINRINDGMKTSAELEWNKQSIQMGLTLSNSSDEDKTDIRGLFDIKSSVGPMKTFSLTVEHTNNGRKMDNNAVLQYNKKSFGLTSSIRGVLREFNLNTDGDITLTLPSNAVAVNWNHKNTLAEISSSSKIDVNGKSVQLNLNGIQDMSLPKGTLSASVEINTPFNDMNSLAMQINHSHDINHVDSTLKFLKDSTTIGQSDIKYLNENGLVTSKIAITNPVYSGDMTASFIADSTKKPATAELEVSLVPLQKVVLSGSLNFDSLYKPNFDVIVNLLLPNTSAVTVSVTQQEQKNAIEAILSVKYASEKEIRIESVRRNDRRKELQLKLMSPFTENYSAAAMYNFNKNKIETSGSIEAEPFIGKWSMDGLLDYSDGVSGNIRINTPYQDSPYSQMSVSSNLLNDERKTTLEIEYVTGRKINLQASSNIRSVNDFALSVEVSSPFAAMSHSKGTIRFSGDSKQFSQFGEVEYPVGKKTTIESRFSVLSGVTGSLKFASPITEDISASFSYESLSNGFQAQVDASYNMNVHVECRHESTQDSFTSTGKLSVDEKNFAGTVSLQLQPDVYALLSAETPSLALRISNKFDGAAEKFTDNLEVSMSDYGLYTATVNVDLQSTVDISATLQTPVKGFRNLKAAFKHDGSVSSFQTHAEVQNGVKMYSGDIKFDSSPALNFDANINTPYTTFKILRLSMNIEGSAKNFKLHGELQKNKELSVLDINSNTMKKWDIDLTLRSPYVDTVKVSLDHWGKLSKFQTKLTAALGATKIRSNAKFQLNPSLNALLSIRSPIRWLKNHQISLKHAGSLNSFKCNMKYILNGKTYLGDATFQNTNSLKGEMNLKGPAFRPLKASVSHEGRPQNFKSAAALSMGQKSINLNANVNTVNGFKGNLDINTPFDGFEKINAAVSHSGDFSKFDSHGELALNKRQGQIDMSFDSTNGITGSVSLSTPLSGLRDVSSSFRHTGDLNSFTTSGKVSKNGQGLEGRLSFNNNKVVTGSASLKSTIPGIDNYDISFAHQGDLSNFNTNAELAYGSNTHTAAIDFSSQNGYQGNFKIDSPLLKNTEIQFKHSMSNTSINSEAFVEYDGIKQYNVRADLTSLPSLSGVVTINTPHDGYETTELTLHHNGDNNGFRSNAAFQIFGEKYEAELGLSAAPDMQLFLTLKSPLFQDIESTLSYEGTLTRFNSRYELTYGKSSQLRVETSVNFEGPISGDFKIISPHMKNFKASFSHNGNLNSFSSEAQVIYAGQKTTGTASFKMSPRIEALIVFTSPFSKDLQMTVSHSGPITNCQTSVSVSYGRQSLFTLDSIFNLNNDLKAEVRVSSLLSGYESFEARLSKEGDLTDLEGRVEVILGKSSVSGDITYSPNKVSVTITAPFMEILSGSFDTSDQNLLTADANSKLTYGDFTLFDIRSRMNLPNTADLTILLPIKDFETSSISYKRSADIGGHFIVDVHGTRHEADAYMNTGKTISALVALNSPLLTPMSTSIDYTRTLKSASCRSVTMYGNEKVEIETELRIRPDMSGRLTIKAPFFETIDSSASFEGRLSNFKSSATIIYGENVTEVKASLNMEDKVEGQISIKSPLMIPVEVTFEQTGPLYDFGVNVVVIADSNKHSFDATFKKDEGIETSFDLKSATIGSTNGLLRVEGQLRDFNVDVEFGRNNLRSTAKATFQLQDDIKGTYMINSPFSDMKGSFIHSGSWRNFQTEVDSTLNGEQYSGKLNFDIETTISADMDINIARMSPIKLSFEHTGTLSNFRTTLKVDKDSSEYISSEMTFTKMPLQGRFSLRTPFENYETVTAMFTHKGEVLNFNNHAEFVVSGKKTEFDMTFNIGTKLEGTLSADSPYFSALSLKFDFSGNGEKSQSHVEASYGKSSYSLDADIDTRSQFDLLLTLQTPVNGYKTVTTKVSHSGSLPNINSFVQVKTSRRNLMTGNLILSTSGGINGKLSAQSIITPTVQLTFDHSGDLTRFNTNGELRLNGEPNTLSVSYQSTPSLSGSLSLQSSALKPISASFMVSPENDGKSIRIDGSALGETISGDLKYKIGNQVGLTASLKTPFVGYEQLDLSSSIKNYYKSFSTIFELEYPGRKMSVESSGNWRNGLTGSISIKTPSDMIGVAKADLSFSGVFPNLQTDLKVEALGQMYSFNSELESSNHLAAKVNVATPLAGFENIGVSFNSEGTIQNMNINGKVVYASEEIVFTFQNTEAEGRLETKSRLETPYTEDVSFDMILTGQPDNFYHSVSLSMGKDNSVELVTTSKVSRATVDIDSTLKTIFTGYSDEHKVVINFDGQLPNYKASAKASVLGHVFSAESDLSVDDVINAHLKINTPIANFRDIELNFEHEGNYRRFSTKAELQYDTNKKIDGNIQFLKYGWRRLETSVEVNTPFVLFETTKASYRHTSNYDGFECDAGASVMNQDFTGTLRGTMSPMTLSLTMTTPFERFQQIGSDMRMVYGPGRMTAQANVRYMDDQVISVSSDVNLNDSPRSGSIKVTTPFAGFETTEMTVSQTGSLTDFEATASLDSAFTSPVRAQANMRYGTWTNLDGSLTFTSQLKNYENIRLSLNNEALRGKYNSKVEMSWAPTKTISLEGSFTDNSYTSSADITLRTPFQTIQQANINTRMGVRGNVYSNKLTAQYNSKVVTDFDVSIDLSARKSLSYAMRSPLASMLKIEGEISNIYDASVTFSPNSDGSNEYKVSGSFDAVPKRLSLRYNDPTNADVSFDGTIEKVDATVNGDRYGYDTSLNGRKKHIKAFFPQRNIMASLVQESGTTEGYFMWDADRDDTKQIGFRSQLTPTEDSVKADITLMMPSLGKDVQIDSEMILNRGRVIFDGKTELSYARGNNKKFTITSRVEDLSTWSSKNFSFTFGISHPYTSVDMQVESHVGNSDGELTGRVGVKYMTVKRQTQEFSAYGQMDKLKNSMSLNIDTPVKKISINGVAQASPYRLSMTNTYDNKRPINTIISLDTVKKSFDFQMNYDLENPSSEFHISAKYVNSSAVNTEIYHVVNRQRVTDILMAVRLNNSHLLHGRLHWRPEMMDDIRTLADRKSSSYKRQLGSFADTVSSAIRSEMRRKFYLLRQSAMEEMEPLKFVVAEQMEKLAMMYERNDYHVRDITDATVTAAVNAKVQMAAAKVATDEYIKAVSNELERKLSTSIANNKERMQVMLLQMEEAIEALILRSSEIYNTYSDHVLNISKPYMDHAASRYNNYVQYMSQIDTAPVTNMADRYTSAIYGAKDYINSGISSLMARDDVKYARSVSDQVYQHGKNAYKYWEIRENTEMVTKAVVDWIREEIENEIADIKAKVLRFKKTALTVYDPEHGEIQAEVHLPIPVKSLDSLPNIDVDMSKMQDLIPEMPSLSFPSWNETSWLPPYDATAFIKGNTISTFDGLTYDLSSSCTFLMAKDYVDGNFSIVLHKDENNKTLVVFADGKAIQLFSNGKVNVDQNEVSMPAVMNDITITSEEGIISIDVADSIDVTFYPDIDTYIITINGFYFGKTNGILGSYDNEPANDLMTSYGKTIDNADRFVKTWEVGTARCS